MPCHRLRLGLEVLDRRDLLSTVNFAGGLSAHPSESFLAPVLIDDAAGVRAAEIRINYDTRLLDADTSSVLPGSVWSGRGGAISKVDDEAGTIVAFVYSARELESAAGSLVDIRFVLRGDPPPGSTAMLDLAEVRLNEGQIPLDPAPQPKWDGSDAIVIVEVSEPHAVGVEHASVPLGPAPHEDQSFIPTRTAPVARPLDAAAIALSRAEASSDSGLSPPSTATPVPLGPSPVEGWPAPGGLTSAAGTAEAQSFHGPLIQEVPPQEIAAAAGGGSTLREGPSDRLLVHLLRPAGPESADDTAATELECREENGAGTGVPGAAAAQFSSQLSISRLRRARLSTRELDAIDDVVTTTQLWQLADLP